MKNGPFLVCDDFGYSEEVDSAILQLAEGHVIDATSILVTPDFSMDRVPLIKNIDVGLHLNLTEGRPVLEPSQIPSLVDAHGCFYPLSSFLLRLSLGQIKADQIKKEVTAQFNIFLKSVGKPTHIDGHQHVQYHPMVLASLMKVLNHLRLHTIRVRLGAPLLSTSTRPSYLSLFPLSVLQRRFRAIRSFHTLVDYDTHPQMVDQGDVHTEVMLHVASSFPLENRVRQFKILMEKTKNER